jgi:N-acetylmuramoyl-L-alanine amidase
MALVIATASLAVGQPGALAQERPELRVERSDGTRSAVAVAFERGYAAVPLDLFTELGWTVALDGAAVSITVPGEMAISMSVGSPFFRWDGVVLQLADALYTDRGSVFVPLQLLSDFLPRRLPDLYEFDGPSATLRTGSPAARSATPSDEARAAGDTAVDAPAGAPGDSAAGVSAVGGGVERSPIPVTQGPSPYDGVRVVVIDAGHGGADPGVLGPAGIREKTVALGIAQGLAAILRQVPDLEVHMTRDDDTFVDLWKRGEIATDLKGDRPGIFVSIHANSVPGRRAATGFETYFLSEARTEHERRVAAIENAPLSFGQGVDAESQPDIDFILRELRSLDHQHWSALLAEFVQDELHDFHPGPNRGVKQGVLAVLTNALMPSVLVEVGYLSDDAEGKLLGEASFQADAAAAIAEAVIRFFERYPPGAGRGGSDGRRQD